MDTPTKRRPSARAKRPVQPSSLLPALYVRLEPDIDHRLRLIALRRRRTLTEIVTELIAACPVPSEVVP